MFDEKYVTIKELMEMSGVSRRTIWRDIKNNKLNATYFGRNVRIKEGDATAYAEEKKDSAWVNYYKK